MNGENCTYYNGDFWCKIQGMNFCIRSYMLPGIRDYVELGMLPGSFLQSVISNDFRWIVHRADMENLCNLPAYVFYFENFVNPQCWGSAEKMKNWAAQKEGRRLSLRNKKE